MLYDAVTHVGQNAWRLCVNIPSFLPWCFLDQELTVHINVSVEQHTHSLKQLLNNISTNQEAVKELERWGLEISSDILVVRTRTHTFNISSNILVVVIHASLFFLSVHRLRVELCPWRPFACSLPRLSRLRLSTGRERWSETRPSAV